MPTWQGYEGQASGRSQAGALPVSVPELRALAADEMVSCSLRALQQGEGAGGSGLAIPGRRR